MKALRPSAVLLGTAALLGLTVFGACERSPTQPSVMTVSAAKVVKDPTVESTDPASAEQDTTLDVEVSGSGFDNGSVVDFGREGEPTPGYIKTNHTRFVGPKKLIANITIADTALVAMYDVMVTTSRGKKGIGTEMFQVKLKEGHWDEFTSLIITYDDDGSKIRSDGHGVHGSTYTDNVCGVYAKFTLNDATMDPDRYPITGKQKNACGGRDPRSITMAFDDPVEGTDPGPVLQLGAFMNVDQVETVTVDDGTVLKKAQFASSYCRLEFSPDEVPGSNMVQVTKNTDGTWTVETQPYPNDVASCADGVRRYHIPFRITVRSLP
jgi:hypothetical protein